MADPLAEDKQAVIAEFKKAGLDELEALCLFRRLSPDRQKAFLAVLHRVAPIPDLQESGKLYVFSPLPHGGGFFYSGGRSGIS